jgi:uncharacterized membrane protein SpoIIM required for sporulation
VSQPTATLRLKSQQFRAEREADWRRLEGLLARVEGRSATSLGDEELLALPVLYRSALSSLSVARATSLDHALVQYLESLSARAYFVVYGPRASIRERLTRFFASGWPASVRSLWRETLVAALVFWLAVGVGYLLVDRDHSWYGALVGEGYAQGRDFTATTAQLKETIYPSLKKDEDLSVFASFLFTNNSQVSLMAFALGFAFGAPTVFVLAQNALGLGAMLDLFGDRGLGPSFAAWIAIHGTTELFAIILSGAAGLRMGWSLAFPGARTRLEAAKAAGVLGARVMTGVVVMLAVAGMLEGFGRQLIQNDLARAAIGATVLLLWLAYFYLPRSAPRAP